MRISETTTDEAVLRELGTRLERTRLEKNLTQGALAAIAGISRATLQRVESGQIGETQNLVRVLRALGLVDGLDRLVPEPVASPLEQLALQGKQRRRASRATRLRPTASAPWSWGDQPPQPSG